MARAIALVHSQVQEGGQAVTLEERIREASDGVPYPYKGNLREIAVEARKMEDRIKQLENRIHRAASAFFRDGSDASVANGMLAILEEERRKP